MITRRGNQSRIMIPGDAVQLREFIPSVAFLFRDDFTTDEGAPISSPRTPEPGPGSLALVDGATGWSIVSSQLTHPNEGGYRWGSGNQSQVQGLAGYAKLTLTTIGFNGIVLGWGDRDDPLFTTDFEIAYRNISTNLRIETPGVLVGTIATFSLGQEIEFWIILGTDIHFAVIDNVLVWIEPLSITNDPLPWAIWETGAIVSEYNNIRVSQLPAPWDTDNGIATEVLAGVRSAGDTFTHEADCLIEFEVTTLPSSGQIELYFRIADSTPASEDLWAVTIDSSGNLDLDEYVGGSPTQRGTSAGVVANGDRIVIIADDEAIRVFEASNRRIVYNSAASSKTATAGELQTEGTGGSVSDIISWPRTLSGMALAALNAVAA